MFKLHDLRETRVWKEAHQEGKEEGLEEGIEKGKKEKMQEVVERLQANGQTQKQIAELLEISVSEVRRLTKKK